ncbi:MAG: hypothetical protein ABIH41_06755 [Nanoarchaeota archaeon]
MPGYEDYIHIKEISPKLEEAVLALKAKLSKSHPDWTPSIEIHRDLWPEGNTIRVHFGHLSVHELAEVDHKLEAILKKHKQTFEVHPIGYSSKDE